MHGEQVVLPIACCAAFAMACATSGSRETAGSGAAVVAGTITYGERAALPNEAVIDVRLIDATRQDAAAEVIAQKTLRHPAGEPPISFELPYDESDIEPTHIYQVRAAIRSGDQLIFSTTSAQPVITRGSPRRVNLVLERVRPSSRGDEATAHATVAIENTYWKLIVLGGRPRHMVDNATEPNVRFEPARHALRGSTGCNSLTGSYVLSGDSLRFTQVGLTRRACTDEEMNRQEKIFVDALNATRKWRVTGDTLMLTGDPGELARFAAVYFR